MEKALQSFINPEEQFYKYYISLFYYIFCFIFQTIALILMTHTLYCAHFSKNSLKNCLALSMKIYLKSNIFILFPSIIFSFYLLFFWRTPYKHKHRTLYDPYWLFWMGISYHGGHIVVPMAVTLLTIDRCYTYIIGLKYKLNMQRCMLILGVIIIILCYFISMFIILMELPLPLLNGKLCIL